MSADPKLAAAPPVAQPTAGGRCPGGVVPAGPFGPAWLPYGCEEEEGNVPEGGREDEPP